MTTRPMNIENARRICPECGEPFTATHGRQQFCSPGHKQAFADLNATRGKVLLPLAQVWRTGKRGKSPARSYALSELCALLDRYAAEDKAAGRRPDLVVERKRGAGWAAADLG